MSRLLPALFLTALLGLVLCGALVLARVHPLLLVPYAAAAMGAAWLTRRRVRPAPLPEGRTCTCCTSTVHDPVEVR
jgi:hypothetical protein